MWLCLFSSRQVEDTYENSQRRKVKQVQPMWLYASSHAGHLRTHFKQSSETGGCVTPRKPQQSVRYSHGWSSWQSFTRVGAVLLFLPRQNKISGATKKIAGGLCWMTSASLTDFFFPWCSSSFPPTSSFPWRCWWQKGDDFVANNLLVKVFISKPREAAGGEGRAGATGTDRGNDWWWLVSCANYNEYNDDDWSADNDNDWWAAPETHFQKDYHSGKLGFPTFVTNIVRVGKTSGQSGHICCKARKGLTRAGKAFLQCVLS